MKNLKKFYDYKLNEDDSFSLNSKGEFQNDEFDEKTGKKYTYEEGNDEDELEKNKLFGYNVDVILLTEYKDKPENEINLNLKLYLYQDDDVDVESELVMYIEQMTSYFVHDIKFEKI